MENAIKWNGDATNSAVHLQSHHSFDDMNAIELMDSKMDMSETRRINADSIRVETKRNSILATQLTISRTPASGLWEENDVKKLEARDRIHRAKEDAFSKHQHNWGMFYNFADGNQMENITREEWDTEVFHETLDEPTWPKVHRVLSICCHLAMFAFCLYAMMTITDDTLENGGQNMNESDLNFVVCPELCRPDSTTIFDFKETGTCKRNFTSEFDNFVWRQSTHLDKNCADTCQRHSMKCKAYYPKDDSGLPQKSAP